MKKKDTILNNSFIQLLDMIEVIIMTFYFVKECSLIGELISLNTFMKEITNIMKNINNKTQ